MPEPKVSKSIGTPNTKLNKGPVVLSALTEAIIAISNVKPKAVRDNVITARPIMKSMKKIHRK